MTNTAAPARPDAFHLLLDAIREVDRLLADVDTDLASGSFTADQYAAVHMALVGAEARGVDRTPGLLDVVRSVAGTAQKQLLRAVERGDRLPERVNGLRPYVTEPKSKPRTDWTSLIDTVAQAAHDRWLEGVKAAGGEVTVPEHVAIARAVMPVAGCAPSSTPKVNAGKKLGVDVKPFTVYDEVGEPTLAWTATDTRTKHPGDRAKAAVKAAVKAADEAA